MSQQSVPVHLCRRCQALSFDDARLGGRKVQTEPQAPERLELPLKEPDLEATGNIPLNFRLTDKAPDFRELAAGASLGCGFCRLLKDAIQAYVVFEEQADVVITMAYRWSRHRWNVGKRGELGLTGLFVQLHTGKPNTGDTTSALSSHGTRCLRFLIDGGSDECARWLSLGPPLVPHALHPANVNWVRSEIDQCERLHSHGATSGNDNFLPSRLIDVGHDDSGVSPRLVITDYRLRRRCPPYVALSYCWGTPADSATQFKTTKASLPARTAGFATNTMTNVMQDAVATTRALGIRYIWIDAVCIIQDDLADWEIESSTMRDVYENAHVTICTIASPSCHTGFLERNPPAITVPFQSAIDPSIKGSISLRTGGLATPTPYIDHDIDLTFQESENDGKWAQRAWTFQESMLSTRKLYFGSFQLAFSCPKHTTTDTGLAYLNGDNQHGVIPFPTHPQSRHEAWHEVVIRFASRDLTHEKDRLPAFSGLARVMGLGPEQYYAGHWKPYLAVSLCWLRDVNAMIPPPPTRDQILRHKAADDTYGAPSWSWAVRRQAIFVPGSVFDCREEAKSITARTQLHGSDPFGRVSDGFLRLEGKLFRLGKGVKIVREEPSGDSSGLGVRFDYRCVRIDGEKLAHVGLDWNVTEVEEDGDGLALLLLVSSLWDYGGPRRERYGFGIVLHPCRAVPGKYIRVGAFETTPLGYKLSRRLEYRPVEVI
ncbi:heterokaryon incompatibility protein-domain-containing protein [Podospora aff. communis PSN243]|uniref:Heterokaryon incompatibility protein-domain-containing protein n=1 Tax=Podospora aff. communis PSN243 TaxID=3040156 RepID=A0AAV9GRM9_9PEZI|nr:heterokaryon incompatibility protein-domain-containing protein [Podospora aff. communis PSN243]